MDFLDSHVGKEQYTLFLSADHGVAHIPGFLKEYNIPAGRVDMAGMIKAMNEKLKEKYTAEKLITGTYNHQVVLNHAAIDSLKLNKEEIKKWIVDYVSVQPVVARAFPVDKLNETTLNEKVKKMIANGYYPQRCGDIQIILQSQWMESFGTTGTTHGSWNPYDAHIPLLWYGWGIKQGKLNSEVFMTDIAPTLAALLHIQMPSGSVGDPIGEIFK
jgi:arylsulfatase A-like enzyme